MSGSLLRGFFTLLEAVYFLLLFLAVVLRHRLILRLGAGRASLALQFLKYVSSILKFRG
jgi:hypothetical protein